MATNSRDIRRRIKSIKNIGQITKAMELVSAAKMRKAQQAAIASRPYAILSSQLLRRLASKVDPNMQPLLNRVMPENIKTKPERILAILISSDRGLAGAFNTNLINSMVSLLKKEGGEKFDFITIGRKGMESVRRLGYKLIATFPAKDKNILILDAKPIAEIAISEYLKFKYEKVFIIYTDFVSTLIQKPNILQILPFSPESNNKLNNNIEDDLFEPSAPEVLDRLVHKIIHFTVYQSLVEAAASEHSARMLAMRNANEAANDLIEDLSLTYNQVRQAGITRELAEISAAKLAMEN